MQNYHSSWFPKLSQKKKERKKEMTKEERMSIRNEQIAKRERGNERHRKDVQNKNQFFLCSL